VKKSILNDVNQGLGPIQVAKNVRHFAEEMPKYAAERLTRTLQITSYRDAETAQTAANDGVIDYKIRIAALDDKTCLSCIELHGSVMKPDERVDDHYNGRCTSIYSVKGQNLQIQKGSDWFNGLSPERQAQQRSFVNNQAKFRAFQDGVPLSDFVGTHTDDVFGNQFVEMSLKNAFGDKAQDYYAVK
jgi:SPP1 gp7 family putative phage head morphogenesis protein